MACATPGDPADHKRSRSLVPTGLRYEESALFASLQGHVAWRVAVFLTIATIAVNGCRDSEPPPAYDRDLGENGVVLLPPATQQYDPAIVKGKADWRAFRDPSEQPPPAADEGGAGQNKQVENEIHELIDEYNEVVVDGTVTELLDYYVEDQHERLKPLLNQATDLRTSLADLRKQLSDKLPEAQDRVAKAFDRFDVKRTIGLDVDVINVVTDTEVTAGSATQAAYRFRLIDEDWYIEVAAIEQFASTGMLRLEKMTSAAGVWMAALQSGQSQADDVLQQMEAAAQSADAASTNRGEEQPAPADESGGDKTEGG